MLHNLMNIFHRNILFENSPDLPLHDEFHGGASIEKQGARRPLSESERKVKEEQYREARRKLEEQDLPKFDPRDIRLMRMNLEETGDSLIDDYEQDQEDSEKTRGYLIAQGAICDLRELQFQGKGTDAIYEELAKNHLAPLALAAKKDHDDEATHLDDEYTHLNVAVRSLAEARFPEEFAKQTTTSKK
jgi:hypothetical protein